MLEVLPDGHGFLRSPDSNYLAAPDDIYVAPFHINGLHLKTGDTIAGRVRPPLERERYFTLVGIDAVNFEPLHRQHQRKEFNDLQKADSQEPLRLETTRQNLCGRVIDLMVPLGKGLNGLISGTPGTGEKLLMETIVNAIATNHPEVEITVLLIDEEPEEAAAMKRSFKADLFFSTSNEPEARHIQLAEIVIEKAKRLVEQGRDVIVLMDSISRLIHAYDVVLPRPDNVRMAAIDRPAAQRAGRFLAATGKFQEGGSLAVIAVVEVGTEGSADATINQELEKSVDFLIVLDRRVLNAGIFPAIDIHRSRNRKEERLLPKEELDRILILRRVLSPLAPAEAVKLLGSKLIVTRSNKAFLANMAGL